MSDVEVKLSTDDIKLVKIAIDEFLQIIESDMDNGQFINGDSEISKYIRDKYKELYKKFIELNDSIR